MGFHQKSRLLSFQTKYLNHPTHLPVHSSHLSNRTLPLKTKCVHIFSGALSVKGTVIFLSVSNVTVDVTSWCLTWMWRPSYILSTTNARIAFRDASWRALFSADTAFSLRTSTLLFLSRSGWFDINKIGRRGLVLIGYLHPLLPSFTSFRSTLGDVSFIHPCILWWRSNYILFTVAWTNGNPR